jgi:hypothetical protein
MRPTPTARRALAACALVLPCMSAGAASACGPASGAPAPLLPEAAASLEVEVALALPAITLGAVEATWIRMRTG